jgi:multidrug efflux pump subunit AcrA (membrane-fusion protein)
MKKTLCLIAVLGLGTIGTFAFSQAPATSRESDSAPSPSDKAVAGAATTNEKSGPKSKAPPAKTFPTSSQTYANATAASSERKELVIERALVTLIDDNKVPATEPGMITKLDVKEGTSVEEGYFLAEIDTRSTLAKRKIAESEHAAAIAQAENDAEVEVAEKAVEVSKAEYDQSVEIRRKNEASISLTQLRKDQFAYEKSLAQVKQAVNEKKIAGLNAQAKQSQYDAASIELDLRTIRAPFKGQVVEVLKNVGDWVTSGEPIMHLVGLDKLKVKGFVMVSGPNGASAAEVLGKPVTITVEAPGGKQHTVQGLIGFASPVIDGLGTNRQFRVWAEVDNEKGIDPVTGIESWKIQPGSMAKMTIDLTPRRNVMRPVSENTETQATSAKSRER